MYVEVTTQELSTVVTRFNIDPVQFKKETGTPFEKASTETIYSFAIGQPDQYEVIEDSPERVVRCLGHET